MYILLKFIIYHVTFMKINKRQEKIIQLLNLWKPLHLKDLIIQLPEIEKRTLIRDLNKLLDNNSIIKEWIGKNTIYKISPIFFITKKIDVE